MSRATNGIRLFALFVAAALFATPVTAQSRLRTMPGYDQWSAMAPQITTAVKSGAVNAEWAADSKSFAYVRDGVRWRFDLAKGETLETPDAGPATSAAPAPTAANRGADRRDSGARTRSRRGRAVAGRVDACDFARLQYLDCPNSGRP
ncbi:MAG: hypothetical protein IPO30_14630 [Hyphomonadaceae bacterium]|nr:hypothetical protein [Hyphomonadaceae bacterium]